MMDRQLAVLVVILTVEAGRLRGLLIRRSAEPFKEMWSLPGGLLVGSESLDEAAGRKLDDGTGGTEGFMGRALDKRNFRKRVLSLGIIESTGQRAGEGRHRPAQLYRFRERKPVVF